MVSVGATVDLILVAKWDMAKLIIIQSSGGGDGGHHPAQSSRPIGQLLPAQHTRREKGFCSCYLEAKFISKHTEEKGTTSFLV